MQLPCSVDMPAMEEDLVQGKTLHFKSLNGLILCCFLTALRKTNRTAILPSPS